MIAAIRSPLIALLLGLTLGASGSHAAAELDGTMAKGDLVQLTPAQIAMAGISSAPATTAPVGDRLRFPAEIALNANRVAEIVPRVGGRVHTVKSDLGQNVAAGATMAVIESRDLAAAKAAYLSAREKRKLADETVAREERLWKQRISAEQDYLVARQAAATARIDQDAAAQQLRALGLDPGKVSARTSNLAEMVVTAPFAGTVIERHVVQGEQVSEGTTMFRLADLTTVWVMARVPESGLAEVALDRPATVTVRAYPDRTFEGRVTWVGATLDEATRTLLVRVEVDNRDHSLKAGMFAEATLATSDKRPAVIVPIAAIQEQENTKVVFVVVGDNRFALRPVQLGARTGDAVEIVAGVEPGEQVVINGGFALLSELGKDALEAD